MSPIAKTTDLHKIYGDEKASRAALAGVSVSIDRGELVAVHGQSGSGKSTLLGILGGLDRSYRGKVELFGQDLAALDDRALAALRGEKVGFVFQAFHLLAHLTVLDNVLAPRLFSRGDDRDATARARSLLDRVGLGDRAGDLPGALSGGQRQRVAIARALVQRPKLLLADEPTGNLDAETGAAIVGLLVELHREEELTVVVVTHEERTLRAASRAIELREGKVVA